MLKNILTVLGSFFLMLVVAAVLIIGEAAMAQVVAQPAAAVPILDQIYSLLDHAHDIVEILGTVVLIVVIAATVIGRICFQISQGLKKKRLSKKVGKVLTGVEKVSDGILTVVQHCPTLFVNPRTKLMIEELQQLKEKQDGQN